MKTEDLERLQELVKDEFDVAGFNYEQNTFLVRKIPERVKVQLDGWGLVPFGFKVWYNVPNFKNVKDKDDFFDYITKQIETYLNDTNSNKD
jgi:hypothetical protein